MVKSPEPVSMSTVLAREARQISWLLQAKFDIKFELGLRSKAKIRARLGKRWIEKKVGTADEFNRLWNLLKERNLL